MIRRTFLQQVALLSSLKFGVAEAMMTSNGDGDRTGVVLDPLFLKHDLPSHPENAKRLTAIDSAMREAGLWEQLTPVASRKATVDEVRWAHRLAYIEEIRLLSEDGGGFYEPWNNETYLNHATYEAALMAAGSNINLNLAVYDRKVSNGFALLRPPGHHALENRAMGFCIFNSDVIAARALQKYRGVKRVAIVDFDVHHGNGTQDLTDHDSSILAVSIHQHPYWPMTGKAEFTGNPGAENSILNCPFPEGAGNTAYLRAFDEIIVPRLKAFQPEHIIVFAGYDAHWQDPLARHQMSVTGFSQLVKRCLSTAEELCGGRISFSLGGGYKLEPLAQSVVATFHQLLGQPERIRDTLGEAPEGETDMTEQLAYLTKLHVS